MKICKFVMPEVIFGPGSLGQIAESAQRLGAEKVFLVTDEGLRRAGWMDKAVAILHEWGMDFEVWDKVTPVMWKFASSWRAMEFATDVS